MGNGLTFPFPWQAPGLLSLKKLLFSLEASPRTRSKSSSVLGRIIISKPPRQAPASVQTDRKSLGEDSMATTRAAHCCWQGSCNTQRTPPDTFVLRGNPDIPLSALNWMWQKLLCFVYKALDVTRLLFYLP